MGLSSNTETVKALKEIQLALADRIREAYPNISPKERDKRVEEILKVHGLNEDKFNVINSFETVLEAQLLADASIDDNSNKGERGITSSVYEAITPYRKLLGYRNLYRTMRKMYGKDEAKRLSGLMYDYTVALSDSSKIMLPYCWAGDFSSLIIEGREWGQLYSTPAKTLRSYIGALNETVHSLSNHLAGAVAIASFFTDSSKVLMDCENISLEELKENKEIRKHIENSFQSFVHSMNSLTRTGATESPFVNISIFDRTKNLQKARDLSYFFDKKDPEYIADYLMELQRIYMDFFSKGDPTKNGIMYRFPVSTINITKDDDSNIVDLEFLDEVVRQEIFRYNIFVSEKSKDASCCFSGDTDVLIKTSKHGVERTTFNDIANREWADKPNLSIFHDGAWSSGKTVKLDKGSKKLYKIITKNKKEIIATEDHLFPTDSGIDKRVDELTSDDYLMFNTSKSYGVNEQDLNLTYEQGILVGAYLGDGSIYQRKDCEYRETVLSLNESKVETLQPLLEKISDRWVVHPEKNNIIKMKTSDRSISEFIQTWVTGKCANEKGLHLECLQQSPEFRQGIIDGLYITDGGHSNRIYTTSEKLRNDLESVLTSLGKITVSDQDDHREEIQQFRDETHFIPNFVVQCIRWYEPKNKRIMKDLFKRVNGNTYFKIDSISEIEYEDENVYCFEMKNKEEPYFTLPNGIITHNCRMLSSEEMLALGAQSNSFGGGGVGQLGSHRVITIDYFRLAVMNDTFEDYLKDIGNHLEDSIKILKAHREMLLELQAKGFQPFIDRGYIDMTRMFSTFGILGVVEASALSEEKYGITKDDYFTTVLEFVNKTSTNLAKKYKMPTNIEQIPAESMSHRIPEVNRILFGKKICDYPLFSNQFIPMWEDASLWDRMEIDGKYGKLYTGGGIVHFSLGERTLPEQNKKIIEHAIKTGCEHFSLNPIYSVCEDCGNTKFAKLTTCDQCGSNKIEYYTRTVGFFTPVKSGWSKPKQEYDFSKRVFKNIED